MSVLPSLLFGISASLDALLVGCALGLQKVPLPAKHNLLISAVTLIGTVISISLGNLLLPLLPGEIATRIGSSILILFGLYYAGKWLVSRWRCSSSDNSSLCREKYRLLRQHYRTSLSACLDIHLFLFLRIPDTGEPPGTFRPFAASRRICRSHLRVFIDPVRSVAIISLMN